MWTLFEEHSYCNHEQEFIPAYHYLEHRTSELFQFKLSACITLSFPKLMQSLLRVHTINIITWSTEQVQSIKFKTSACINVSSEQKTSTASTDTLPYTHPSPGGAYHVQIPQKNTWLCKETYYLYRYFTGTLQILYYLA